MALPAEQDALAAKRILKTAARLADMDISSGGQAGTVLSAILLDLYRQGVADGNPYADDADDPATPIELGGTYGVKE